MGQSKHEQFKIVVMFVCSILLGDVIVLMSVIGLFAGTLNIFSCITICFFNYVLIIKLLYEWECCNG